MPRAGRHLHFFTLAEQYGELDQQYLEPVGILPQAFGRGTQAGHVAVVVGSEYIDGAVKTTLDLVQKIGNIRCKIGGPAILANYDTVFFVTQGRGAKPGCTVFQVQVAVFAQTFNCVFDSTAVFQLLFGEPQVEMHIKVGQVILDIIQDAVQSRIEKNGIALAAQQLPGTPDQGVNVNFPISALGLRRWQAVFNILAGEAPLVTVFGPYGAGNVINVVTLIAVFRKLYLLAT